MATAFDSATGYGAVNAYESPGDDGSGNVQPDDGGTAVTRPTVADMIARMWPDVD